MKHQVGEVDERNEDVLRDVVDAVVRQRQAEQVVQAVEGAIVEELDDVSGQTEHAQVVHVEERLAVKRLRITRTPLSLRPNSIIRYSVIIITIHHFICHE